MRFGIPALAVLCVAFMPFDLLLQCRVFRHLVGQMPGFIDYSHIITYQFAFILKIFSFFASYTLLRCLPGILYCIIYLFPILDHYPFSAFSDYEFLPFAPAQFPDNFLWDDAIITARAGFGQFSYVFR